MSIRPVVLSIACVAAAALTAGPAAAQTPTDHPVPGVKPGACTDQIAPTSTFAHRWARRARRKHVVRGTARDLGCGLDRVTISVLRKRHGRCQNLKSNHRLGVRSRCFKRHWLAVSGTTRWSFRLPKRLPPGRYLIRTRAVDFAGNVEIAQRHRLRIR
jgi:hypothetical protein